jgi:hypothetical protein
VWLENLTWQVDFKPQNLRPSVAIPVEFKMTNGNQPSLFMTVNRPGPVIQLNDPEMGDTIFVVPNKITGRGINGERNYADFSLLPTAQGVAVIPKSTTVKVQSEIDGVLVTAESGLNISLPTNFKKREEQAGGLEEYGPSIAERTNKPPMISFGEWRGDPNVPFFKKEYDLLMQIGTLDKGKRESKRLELARLYFGYGRMVEALAILEVLAADNDILAHTPEFLAMRGVANIQEWRFKPAVEDLKDQRWPGKFGVAPLRTTHISFPPCVSRHAKL